MTAAGRSDRVRVGLAGVPRPVGEQVRPALTDVATLAAEVLPGCLGVGVSLAVDGEVRTVALTSDVARLLDEAQYGSGDGPCLEALVQDEETACDDYGLEQRWPDACRLARSMGVGSSLSIPLHVGTDAVGALNLYAGRPGAFEGSRRSAHALARRGEAALRDVRQRRVVEALERSLWPALPTLPGLASAVRHGPAPLRGGRIGEWQDLFPLPDGAIGLVLGDAVGCDEDVPPTIQVRTVLRSCAHDGASPSLVVDRMDSLVRGFDMARQAAVLYGRLVSDAEGAMLLYTNAGQPPPLLRRPDGTVLRLAGASSPPIGAPSAEVRPRSEAAAELPGGSVLLLYPHDVVRRICGHRAMRPGQAIGLIADTVAGLPGDPGPSAVCQAVLDLVVPVGRQEDPSLLAVRIAGRDSPRADQARWIG